MVSAGAVVSEAPPGHPAQAWRFPSRNRVIAGLADLLVVVESHAAGGSLLTADAALARGVEVRVVPGPVGSPAAAGTNQLLYDGAGPVRDATDVLDALGLLRDAPSRQPRSRPVPPSVHAGEGRPVSPRLPGLPGLSEPDAPPGSPLRSGLAVRPVSPGPPGLPGLFEPAMPPGRPVPPWPPVPPGPPGRPMSSGGGDPVVAAHPAPEDPVLEAVGWQPTSVARIVARCGRPVGEVGAALERLHREGHVREDSGWWTRRR
jgi:predicted Rossmann fold nucleotide-binding protein DprA/Smf involved in DNA uptake